jgi:hypothetical protein
MRKIVILLISCFLFINTNAALAGDFDEGLVTVGDLAISRPFGLVATVIGGAVFIAALPFSLPSGSVKNTADTLVGEPFRFTFKRPLGDYRHYNSNSGPSDKKQNRQDNSENSSIK